MKKQLEELANQPYRTITYFEPEDHSWIAYHPELGQASCYAIGDSEEDARELLKEETKEFLELLLSEGREIPKPQTSQETEDLPSGQFVTRIPRTLHKKLKERADFENVSLNHLISVLLAQSLEQRNLKAMFTKTFEELTIEEKGNGELKPKRYNTEDENNIDIPPIFRVRGSKKKNNVHEPKDESYFKKNK